MFHIEYEDDFERNLDTMTSKEAPTSTPWSAQFSQQRRCTILDSPSLCLIII